MANIDIHKLQLVLEAKGVRMTKSELKSLDASAKSATGQFAKMAVAMVAIGATAKVFSEVTRVIAQTPAFQPRAMLVPRPL